MVHPKILMIGCFLSLSLTACSGEPSESDIKSAIEQNIEETFEATKAMVGDLGGENFLAQFDIEVEDVEKLGCNASSNASGYVCDVKIKMNSQFAGQKTEAASIRMVESKNGWMIIQ